MTNRSKNDEIWANQSLMNNGIVSDRGFRNKTNFLSNEGLGATYHLNKPVGSMVQPGITSH